MQRVLPIEWIREILGYLDIDCFAKWLKMGSCGVFLVSLVGSERLMLRYIHHLEDLIEKEPPIVPRRFRIRKLKIHYAIYFPPKHVKILMEKIKPYFVRGDFSDEGLRVKMIEQFHKQKILIQMSVNNANMTLYMNDMYKMSTESFSYTMDMFQKALSFQKNNYLKITKTRLIHVAGKFETICYLCNSRCGDSLIKDTENDRNSYLNLLSSFTRIIAALPLHTVFSYFSFYSNHLYLDKVLFHHWRTIDMVEYEPLISFISQQLHKECQSRFFKFLTVNHRNPQLEPIITTMEEFNKLVSIIQLTNTYRLYIKGTSKTFHTNNKVALLDKFRLEKNLSKLQKKDKYVSQLQKLITKNEFFQQHPPQRDLLLTMLSQSTAEEP